MTKNRTLLIISFILIILPFIGFSKTWEDILTVVMGVTLAFVAYLYMRYDRLKHTKNEKEEPMFDHEKENDTNAFLDTEKETDFNSAQNVQSEENLNNPTY